MEEKTLQLNAMLVESYDKYEGEQSDETNQEEFVFPFNEEEQIEHSRIHGYGCDNLNTCSLTRREEPLIDDVSLWLHPTPLDLQVCNSSTL